MIKAAARNPEQRALPAAGAIIARLSAGDGGLPGKKIALDLQLPDVAVKIVDHLLRIFDRRGLTAARKPARPRASPAPVSVADHRRMNSKLHRQLRQGLLPRQRCHPHSRLEFRAVLLSLTPTSYVLLRPRLTSFGPVSP